MNDSTNDNHPFDDFGLDNRHLDSISSNDLTSMYVHHKSADNGELVFLFSVSRCAFTGVTYLCVLV